MPVKLPSVVAVDANFLVQALSGKRTTDDYHRASHLLARIEKTRGQLIVPMPALAEYLVLADAASLPILDQLERKAFVRAAPFDRPAATECSQMDAAALGRGDKKDGAPESWQKVKIDRQVVAIAKATGAELIITSDVGVRTSAMRVGIPSLAVSELSLPPEVMQGKLRLVKGKPSRL